MDQENTKKLLTGIVNGVCEEVKNGNRCYHNLLEALKNIATMVDNTIESFETFSESLGTEKSTFLRQCDNFFKPIDVFMRVRLGGTTQYGTCPEHVYCDWGRQHVHLLLGDLSKTEERYPAVLLPADGRGSRHEGGARSIHIEVLEHC